MEVQKMFPVIVGKEKIPYSKFPKDKIREWKRYIFKKEQVNNTGNVFFSKDQNILNDKIFKTLKSEILKNAKCYAKQIGFSCKDLQISNSWSLIVQKNNNSTWHTHKNSAISGVFYLTEGSEIEFMDPNIDKMAFFPGITTENAVNYIKTIEPTENLLLLFPSYFLHRVQVSKEISRISIAFNLLPKGEFGPESGRINL